MTQPSPAQVVHPAGPTLVAMLAVALPMLIAGSVSPTSTFFNQLMAFAGCGLWLLLWARQAAEAPALRLGPAAPWWLGAMVLLALSYLVSDAPFGQRLVPLGCVLLGGALLVASAASSNGGDEAVWAEPLQRALGDRELLADLAHALDLGVALDPLDDRVDEQTLLVDGQHRPQRLELGLPGQCGDPGWRIGCQHVDPADHAQDVRRGLRLLQQESGLRFGRRRLHQYAAPDAARGTDGTPVVHRHVPVN